MGIRDFIKRVAASSNEELISWRVDPYEGLDFILSKAALNQLEEKAIANPGFGFQLAYLKGLVEQGLAEKNSNGFTVPSEVVPDLGEDFTTLFNLPAPYEGKYQAKFEGNTGQASFSVRVELLLPDGSQISHYSLEGPFLKLAENERYRLSPAEFRAMKALDDHISLAASDRGEYENNWLIFQLQLAKKARMDIDLAHFDNLELISPEAVGVSVEQSANGDLILTPTYGAGLDLSDIKSRLGQVREGDVHTSILRVKDKFVLLDEERLRATQEILTNRRIPKDQVATFIKAPTAYLNAALIDLDTGFSLRVHGAERFTQKYFGDIEESGIDWFAASEKLVEPVEKLVDIVNSEEKLDELASLIDDANKHRADVVEYDGVNFNIADTEAVSEALAKIESNLTDQKPYSISETGNNAEGIDKPETERAVVAIDSNDAEEEFVKDTRINDLNISNQLFSTDNLKRTPFPHQEEGIHWLLAHMDRILQSEISSGALLADDMGLGKTYMTLVAIAEWYSRCRLAGRFEKPVLIVAPLSLLENWQDEVEQTFLKSPFSDIVVLQSGGDLSKFKIKGAGRETEQEFSDEELIEDQDQIRYSLKVGGVYGSERLDLPKRLVLTTYQTLRDYQFSLSRIDWSIVAFDEAHNLKNPNALATRAAKALKSDFKLLATGTPVENTLKDFWCLMDTAVPGLLGAWQTFRDTYISPIRSVTFEESVQVKIEVGRKLRAAVGDYMLRRTKAEKLKGLPEKRIFSGDETSATENYMPVLAGCMKGLQLDHYDDIITQVKTSKIEDKRGLILPSLLRLKVTSIHHDIDSNAPLPQKPKEQLIQAEASAKIKAMLDVLTEIKSRGEKVLIFATTKAVQAYVCALVASQFKITIDIINGETKAVATKQDTETRKAIIDRFQEQEGFGVIVMSPVAAGVGLTVVGANNVIHLERHWNPAKEAQATDRVYRIGQNRDVNVYVPIALHPTIKSFDLQLNTLLANKIDLSDAVVAASVVDKDDLVECF